MNGFGEGLHRVPWDPVAQKFWDPPLPASQGTCGVPVEETLTHSLTHVAWLDLATSHQPLMAGTDM